MKSYIEGFVGDENPTDIDCAILQCLLQEAIYDRLVNTTTNVISMIDIEEVVRETISPYVIPRVSIDWTLTREDDDEGKTIRWISEQ